MTPYNDAPDNEDSGRPGGYEVKDEKNLEEKDLKRTFLGGNDANPDQPGYESHGMGGESFGDNNLTRSGDDEANPSRSAGYTNDYFKRTEPAEEHPEFHNFKPKDQEGEADANMGKGEEQEHIVADDNGTRKYQEGTADADGAQQKGDQKDDVNDSNTSYYTGTPHYRDQGDTSNKQGE
ncbi:hypothetical protein LLH06_14005 [Mucilaginibacter daejeonensis]|uniref:hypothetical protein n=1 Tax=Mucilaginibacter daejeonensis TaxID=398049 RepID=UPI001D17999B|nr:hypothetical protein [Mucilaginibacter daejeonensis]UEG52075.1 hypothetical protein LLH06_14005 [Mucilaginibacter daejeonensis]